MSYEFPAWCQMETALNEYELDLEAYLEAEAARLGPDAEKRLEKLYKLADSLIKGVQNLTGGDSLGSVAELSKDLASSTSKTIYELLMEHACIAFGWEAMEMLETARERFVVLLALLRDRHPCAKARAFLQRVARCYFFGFDEECIVICRATLDREFDDKVIAEDQISDW